jgi:5'-3' exonuclease
MGISDFLTRVLETAGRPCDLRTYTHGVGIKRRRKRRLRIGIDASTWIHTAAHGHGDMLGDERHLTNYGRATLYREQQQQQLGDPASSCNPSEEIIQQYVDTCTKYVVSRMEFLRDTTHANILVVLDGDSPPIKKREAERRRAIRSENERVRELPVNPEESADKTNALRTKAFRRAGAGRYYTRIVEAILKALRQAEIPFLVAPYEADSQLAFLSDMGFLDLVITEDSDLVAHGARTILYKSTAEIGNNRPCGKLLQFSDIGAGIGEKFNLADFSPVMMTVLFVSVGCDYCDKLKGVGLLTASRVIREAFLVPPRLASQKGKSKLTRVLDGLYTSTYLDSSTLTPQFKFDYEERFLAAIFMYRHPIIYDPLQENNFLTSRCLVEPETDHGEELGPIVVDRDLMDHDAYVDLCGDLDRIQDIVGKLRPREEAMRRAQGLNEDQVMEEEAAIPPPVITKGSSLPVEAQEDASAALDPQEESQFLATQGDLPVENNSLPAESQEVSIAALDPQEELQFLATQEDLPVENNKENSGNADSAAESSQGDAVMETLEESLLGDDEDSELGTQPLASSKVKPSSRRLDGEFEAAERKGLR